MYLYRSAAINGLLVMRPVAAISDVGAARGEPRGQTLGDDVTVTAARNRRISRYHAFRSNLSIRDRSEPRRTAMRRVRRTRTPD